MIYGGPDGVENGLVFYYDTLNEKSYKGQPTTNYVTYPHANWNGSGFALSYNYANNGVTYTFDTTVPTPMGDYSGVMRYYTGVTDYKYWSIKMEGLSSGTYAFSYYARASVPGNINNSQLWRDSGTDRSVSGDWNPSYTTEWKRYVTIGPISVGNYLDYFPCHSGALTGGVNVYFWGFQLEKLDHASQFVSGSRSVTQGLLDITGNTTLDLTTTKFDSSATIDFPINASANSYITTNTNCGLVDNATLTAWVKPTFGTDSAHRTIICTDKEYQYGLKLMNYKNYHRWGLWVGWGSSNYEALTITNINDNISKMLTGTWSRGEGIVRLYLNGSYVTQFNTGYTGALSLSTGNIWVGMGYEIGFGNGQSYEGKIHSAAIYNKVLSASEILRLYNATKGRYGL